MKHAVIRTLMLALALVASLPVAATEVRAFLDRDSVHLGDTVTLNLSVTDAVIVKSPDFSVLVPDFVLDGTSRNQSISISNGQVRKTVLFAVALRPRHAGEVTIPAFTVDGKKSQPLTLSVMPADSQASGTPGDPVFLRADIEPHTLYVGQQAHLSVKLYYAGGSLQGKLDEPDIAGADVKKLGKQNQFQSQQGGRMYQVVERDYAIVPHEAGTLAIPSVPFRGQLVTGSNGYFGNSQPVSAQSPTAQLDVRAKPSRAGSGPWLPARSLSLTMQGLPDDGKATVGTPITVTITEKATGLGFEVLPEPSLPSIDGAEVYPDKSQSQNGDDGEWIEGTRVRKFAVVPTRQGSLTLPAIEVDWWNVQTDTPAKASVDARTLVVGAAAMAAGAVASSSSTPFANPGQDSPQSKAAGLPEQTDGSHTWRSLALAGLGLWLLTALLWAALAYRRRQGYKAPAAETKATNSDQHRRAFRQAGDAVSQARSLLHWAQAERSHIRNLSQVAMQLDDAEQCRVLEELERARYTNQPDAPDPVAVRKAFAKGFAWRGTDDKQDKGILPPLYPER